jgi:hypothetical protein
MMRLELPASLNGIFPPYRWHQSKLWALPTPAAMMPTDELWWLLELPVWPTEPPTKIFDLAPARVLASPDLFPRHWSRILGADLAYPLELYCFNSRWILLDGYHRLARMRVEQRPVAAVRRHPPETMDLIARVAEFGGYPASRRARTSQP